MFLNEHEAENDRLDRAYHFNAQYDYYREAHAAELACGEPDEDDEAAAELLQDESPLCKCGHDGDDHVAGYGSCTHVVQQFGPLGLHCICMTFRAPGQPDPEHCATCGCVARIGLDEMEACPRGGCGCHSPF